MTDATDAPAPGGPDPVRDPWRAAMRLALAEAGRAAEGGDVPVGAVVLSPDGTTVLATGHNEREATGDPTAHAEVLALRRAAAALRATGARGSSAEEGGRRTGEWRLTDCTLVVTLEPCTMCAGALVQSRIDRVVYGARDEKAGATGSLWDVVRDRRLNHRPEVVEGVLADDCARLLTEFFRTR
ncbi:putative deaminase [Streptomyces scabiei 87.22]|uniref:tRNA-specific adenosine deaminase n=2 Tax=Streptomyces TaxID=1883 RepID=C9ZDL1_STRSW|nr:putative deaminase [Streptomyces scabiei 87.22]